MSYDIEVDGRPFLIDNRKDAPLFAHSSIPLLRAGSVTSDEVGEKSLNPEAAWRRSQSSWHKGAGQRHLDMPDSDRERFWRSKGVDVWTKGELKPLHTTELVRASTNTNLRLTKAGVYWYLTDGNQLLTGNNISSLTAVTGMPAARVEAVTSNGHTVWAASDKVYSTVAGTSSASEYNALTNVTLLGFVNDRLMAAKGNAIYNIVTSGAAPAAKFTHPTTDFEWTGFCAGKRSIYAAGNSGSRGTVYRLGIKPDGTELDTAVVAVQLPAGEKIRSLTEYVGFVIIGTTNGLRVATQTAEGDLQVGPRISPISGADVCCAFGYQNFVWFGWQQYVWETDSWDYGLGRLDLTTFNDDAPAWASDVMSTLATNSTLDVQSAFIENGGPYRAYFTVSASGLWRTVNGWASGYLDSGLVAFGLPDTKVGKAVDVRHSGAIGGSYRTLISADEGAFVEVGTRTTDSKSSFPVAVSGEVFEIREQLTAGVGSRAEPVLRSHTLMAVPVAASGELIDVPILIAERPEQGNWYQEDRDCAADLAFLKTLRESDHTFTYTEAGTSVEVTMQDYQWRPSHRARDGAWQGTFVARLKTQEVT